MREGQLAVRLRLRLFEPGEQPAVERDRDDHGADPALPDHDAGAAAGGGRPHGRQQRAERKPDVRTREPAERAPVATFERALHAP